jgi:hypothetical protein
VRRFFGFFFIHHLIVHEGGVVLSNLCVKMASNVGFRFMAMGL